MFKETWLEEFHYLNQKKGLENLMRSSRQALGLELPHHSCGSEHVWDSQTFQPPPAKHKDLKSFPVACIKINSAFHSGGANAIWVTEWEPSYANTAFNLVVECCSCYVVCETHTYIHRHTALWLVVLWSAVVYRITINCTWLKLKVF